eukprot:6107048-Pyramimonas_sp.AAC.1
MGSSGGLFRPPSPANRSPPISRYQRCSAHSPCFRSKAGSAERDVTALTERSGFVNRVITGHLPMRASRARTHTSHTLQECSTFFYDYSRLRV